MVSIPLHIVSCYSSDPWQKNLDFDRSRLVGTYMIRQKRRLSTEWYTKAARAALMSPGKRAGTTEFDLRNAFTSRTYTRAGNI